MKRWMAGIDGAVDIGNRDTVAVIVSCGLIGPDERQGRLCAIEIRRRVRNEQSRVLECGIIQCGVVLDIENAQ